MTQPEIDETLLMPNESKLAKAEAKRYIDQQKTANFYTKVADYMFWGATSLILPLVAVALKAFPAPAILGVGLTLGIGSALSVATFVGSLFFARKATELSVRSNVLYSDIDSQNQARRMVQAFARAQSQEITTDRTSDAPYTQSATVQKEQNWQERLNVSGKSAQNSGRWQDQIAAKADREDALALEQFSR